MSRLLLPAAVLFALGAPPSAAVPLLEGRMLARIAVTVDPDERGTILVPSPFTVIPGTNRVALYVPESGGIFVLEDERILHHFPLAPGVDEIQDLCAAGQLLVAGFPSEGGRFTAELLPFDLATGRPLPPVSSANPHLRVDLETRDLWRVVTDGDLAGVYSPAEGATFPLWSRRDGLIPSSDQVVRAVSGIGFGEGPRAVALAGGTVQLRDRAKTTALAGPEDGDFLDAALDGTAALLLRPAATVRADADGDVLLPHELAVRVVRADGTRTDLRLASIDDNVMASRLVIRGRPVRAAGHRLHWLFLGADFLEIREADL
jgi:hypothetical protein